MITIQDFDIIVGKIIANETTKRIIRSNFPPHIAEQMYNPLTDKKVLTIPVGF